MTRVGMVVQAVGSALPMIEAETTRVRVTHGSMGRAVLELADGEEAARRRAEAIAKCSNEPCNSKCVAAPVRRRSLDSVRPDRKVDRE
jgi:hypothetical protein